MKPSMEPDGVWPIVAEVFFFDIWRQRMPFLKCRTFHKFSKCDACGLFNEMLFVSAHNPSLKGVYNEVLLLLLFICYHYSVKPRI